MRLGNPARGATFPDGKHVGEESLLRLMTGLLNLRLPHLLLLFHFMFLHLHLHLLRLLLHLRLLMVMIRRSDHQS